MRKIEEGMSCRRVGESWRKSQWEEWVGAGKNPRKKRGRVLAVIGMWGGRIDGGGYYSKHDGNLTKPRGKLGNESGRGSRKQRSETTGSTFRE